MGYFIVGSITPPRQYRPEVMLRALQDEYDVSQEVLLSGKNLSDENVMRSIYLINKYCYCDQLKPMETSVIFGCSEAYVSHVIRETARLRVNISGWSDHVKRIEGRAQILERAFDPIFKLNIVQQRICFQILNETQNQFKIKLSDLFDDDSDLIKSNSIMMVRQRLVFIFQVVTSINTQTAIRQALGMDVNEFAEAGQAVTARMSKNEDFKKRIAEFVKSFSAYSSDIA